VQDNDALPEGASMRFKALNKPHAVTRIRYQSDDGDEGIWEVFSPNIDQSQSPAWTCLTDDSGAGQSALVYGAELGLRLRQIEGDNVGVVVAEAWILLDPADIL